MSLNLFSYLYQILFDQVSKKLFHRKLSQIFKPDQTARSSKRKGTFDCLLHQQVPIVWNHVIFSLLGTFTWVGALIFSIQTFQPIILIYRRVNFLLIIFQVRNKLKKEVRFKVFTCLSTPMPERKDKALGILKVFDLFYQEPILLFCEFKITKLSFFNVFSILKPPQSKKNHHQYTCYEV